MRIYFSILLVVTLFIFLTARVEKGEAVVSCGFGSFINNNQCRGYITSGTTWTVPTDWTTTNTIEAIGAGGDGFFNFVPGPGGGGGAYASISDWSGTGVKTVQIGLHGGSRGSDADTFFVGRTTLEAEGGASGGTGLGGEAANSLGTVTFDGGDTAILSGGGAAGPNGVGGDAAGGAGGTGDAGHGGVGGAGTGFGGQAGAKGSEWDSTHGSGGGGAGSGSFGGGNGGNYGGGAGSGQSGQGTGANGIIVITYTSPQRVSRSLKLFNGFRLKINNGVLKVNKYQ